MQNVSILGVGQTPVAKQPGQSIGRLASRACQALGRMHERMVSTAEEDEEPEPPKTD